MAKRNTDDPVDLDYADYARWAASQGRAFAPIISAWQSVLGSIPTAGEIRGGYKKGFKTFSDMLGTMDYGAGGAGAGLNAGANPATFAGGPGAQGLIVIRYYVSAGGGIGAQAGAFFAFF